MRTETKISIPYKAGVIHVSDWLNLIFVVFSYNAAICRLILHSDFYYLGSLSQHCFIFVTHLNVREDKKFSKEREAFTHPGIYI